jgi:hypothetical protein
MKVKLISSPIWTRNTGERLTVSQMTTGHIQNCIILLTDKVVKCQMYGLGSFFYNGRLGTEWIAIFKAELKRTGVI